MTKAFLINTASDLAGGDTGKGATIAAGPNTDQGWGRVNLGSALRLDAREYRDQLAADTFSGLGADACCAPTPSPNAAKPVKVTLAWTDAPGPATGNAWVNNLDLEVEAGGRTLPAATCSRARFSRTGGAADIRNNVESVYLPAGTTERFTVTVKGLQGRAATAIPGMPAPTHRPGLRARGVERRRAAGAGARAAARRRSTIRARAGTATSTSSRAREIVLTEQVRNVGHGRTPTGWRPACAAAAGSRHASRAPPTSPGAVGATGSNAPGFEAELPNVATCGVDAPATLDITTTTPAVETHRIALVAAYRRDRLARCSRNAAGALHAGRPR